MTETNIVMVPPSTVNIRVDAGPLTAEAVRQLIAEGTADHVAAVIHGGDGTLARPDAPLVVWVGSVEPAAAAATDIWVEVLP